MSELITDHVKRLEFSDVQTGDIIDVTTGIDDSAWNYKIDVTKSGVWPSGNLVATKPSGRSSKPVPFQLHGCGRWTTPAQNPVQKQPGIAFTPYYQGLIVGSFLWGKIEGQAERLAFVEKGQEISDIAHSPYRENTVLGILNSYEEPLSVKSMTKSAANLPIQLSERDIRETLKNLISRGHVSLLRKNVQLFQKV